MLCGNLRVVGTDNRPSAWRGYLHLCLKIEMSQSVISKHYMNYT